MTSLLEQQRELLEYKFRVLERLTAGLEWSLERLPQELSANIENPAVNERISAIVDRFCKLQDQFAGTLNHVHTMLGEKARSFNDVLTWAVSQNVLADSETWLELRSLRNRLTHEYDLENDEVPALIELVQQAFTTLVSAVERLDELCRLRKLLQ